MMNSLFLRVALTVFASIAVVVIVVAAIVNYQVTDNFSNYVYMNHPPMMHSMAMHQKMQAMMGAPETQFIASLKSLLLILTGLMLLGGAVVSYHLARSITKPIRQLDEAVKTVAAGKLETAVPVTTRDEIGELATGFNVMTAKLKTNDVLRRRFLAGIAHELRTPLTILKANLEGMRDKVIDPAPENIGSLVEETDRLAKLVGDLRDLTLMEAGHFKLEKTLVDIITVARSAVTKISPIAKEKNIEVTIDQPPVPTYVELDATRFTQMLDNLLINAIKFTAPGGHVSVKIELYIDKVKVDVIDNGAGISAQDLPHIFDYFYRADPSRAKESGGTGLGLAIVRQIAEAHGGGVTVVSEPGHGSTFSITLPIK